MKKFSGKVEYVGMIDIELYPDVSILVGESGTGKTQMLKAIAEKAGVKIFDPNEKYLSQESMSEIKRAIRKLYGPCFVELESKNWEAEAYYASASKYFLNVLSFIYHHRAEEISIVDDMGNTMHPDDASCLIRICRELSNNQLVVATHSPALVMDHWFGQLIDVTKCRRRGQ